LSHAERANGAAWALVAVLLSASAGPSAAIPVAPALPPAVTALAPSLVPRGGGPFTFLGFRVYDGWYWSAAPGFSLDQPLALDLHYRRKFDGHAIAVRSVDEMTKLGLGTLVQQARWSNAMRRIFPDVDRGDRLTGISLPSGIVRFFHNGVPIGEIDDHEFARAFFGIWLDPRTSHPDFRKKLLGGTE
jgi:hypothetical protein